MTAHEAPESVDKPEGDTVSEDLPFEEKLRSAAKYLLDCQGTLTQSEADVLASKMTWAATVIENQAKQIATFRPECGTLSPALQMAVGNHSIGVFDVSGKMLAADADVYVAPAKSPTPRTDALYQPHFSTVSGVSIPVFDYHFETRKGYALSCQLERELAEMTTDRNVWKSNAQADGRYDGTAPFSTSGAREPITVECFCYGGEAKEICIRECVHMKEYLAKVLLPPVILSARMER